MFAAQGLMSSFVRISRSPQVKELPKRMSATYDESVTDTLKAESEPEIVVDPLAHLSAEQVEEVYQRYLEGEKTSDLILEFGIQTKNTSLLKLLPHIERNDLVCPHCGLFASQKRPAKNSCGNSPACTGCDHVYPIYRGDSCRCTGCMVEYLGEANGEGVHGRVIYDGLALREKIILLAALNLTEVGSRDETSFSIHQRKVWHHRLAPTPEYRDKCIKELFDRHVILVSSDTTFDALDFYRKHDRFDFLRWTPNVSTTDAAEFAMEFSALQFRIIHDLMHRKLELQSVLIELIYELAEEDLLEYVRYRVESTSLDFTAERATREVLRSLLASSSVSNIFSFIWKAVREAEDSLKNKTVNGPTHAGNKISSAIVRAAEYWESGPSKQKEYERPKQSKICQISEVVYSLILDDPDGSFKMLLPRYSSEILRPVLEGISTAQEAKRSLRD